jgi:hypothetical protein
MAPAGYSGNVRYWREGAGCLVDGHMFQHVGRRSKGILTNLVHADRVPAVIADHESAACNPSSRCVHTFKPTLRRWPPPSALVQHLKGVAFNQKGDADHSNSGRHSVVFLLCTALEQTIGVRSSPVLHALTQSVSRILTEALETHERWLLRQC